MIRPGVVRVLQYLYTEHDIEEKYLVENGLTTSPHECSTHDYLEKLTLYAMALARPEERELADEEHDGGSWL